MLKDISFSIFGQFVQDEDDYYNNFIRQWDLYMNDPEVINRTLTDQQEKLFFDYFKVIIGHAYIVVKGKRDMDALNNTYKLISDSENSKIGFDSYYDIEIFNQFSRRISGSGQLENTYNALIKDKLYIKHIKPFFDYVQIKIGSNAHNPLVDSMFTIVVAIVINIGINKYFANLKK